VGHGRGGGKGDEAHRAEMGTDIQGYTVSLSPLAKRRGWPRSGVLVGAVWTRYLSDVRFTLFGNFTFFAGGGEEPSRVRGWGVFGVPKCSALEGELRRGGWGLLDWEWRGHCLALLSRMDSAVFGWVGGRLLILWGSFSCGAGDRPGGFPERRMKMADRHGFWIGRPGIKPQGFRCLIFECFRRDRPFRAGIIGNDWVFPVKLTRPDSAFVRRLRSSCSLPTL
jgi:hypothetical protein